MMDVSVASARRRSVEREYRWQKNGADRALINLSASGALPIFAHGLECAQTLLLRQRAVERGCHQFSPDVEIPTVRQRTLEVSEDAPNAIGSEGVGRRIEGGTDIGFDTGGQSLHAGARRCPTSQVQGERWVADNYARYQEGARERGALSLRQADDGCVRGFCSGSGACGNGDQWGQ